MRAKRMIVFLLLGLAAGFLLGHFSRTTESPSHGDHDSEQAEFWTCSMHPQIKQPGPGSCPICGMDLVPVRQEDGNEELDDREIKLSPSAQKRAQVEVVPVRRAFAHRPVRLAGKVQTDETRVSTLAARVAGRLDRLYVDYTGVVVNPGDHLVELYSPELLAAQEELIQSASALASLGEGASPTSRERASQTLDSSREKLRLYGLTSAQIQEVEERGAASDHLTMYAESEGIVLEKHAVEGMYVKTGSPIYTVANLSSVWVMLDAYESDLAWIRYGQAVQFSVEAWPGKTFDGSVIFVDPILDTRTRTAKVRVNVPNPEKLLKPGMFVRAVIGARMGKHGVVPEVSLAGKWVSPMHPEIIKDGPGECDVCGMALVPAETLGYGGTEEVGAPLLIPASAPLITGKRAVVYVQDSERPSVFEGREIVLGPRAGAHYIVEQGLDEGETIVAQGAFKIDSAVQILAKPSMMSAEPEPVLSFPVHRTLNAYFQVQEALAADDSDRAESGLNEMAAAIADELPDRKDLTEAVRAAITGNDIGEIRFAFSPLSEAVIAVAKATSVSGSAYQIHCPMALDGGADWLQRTDSVSNPYYGASMLRCGNVVRSLSRDSTP